MTLQRTRGHGPGGLRRERRGYTLLELVVVITIAASLIAGFGMMMYDVAEQMHIQWEMRMAEEYGHYFLNQFHEKLRSGQQVEITRITAPSEVRVMYTNPYRENAQPREWTFQYDQDSGLPAIREAGDIVEYLGDWPPMVMDVRDNIRVDPSSFLITPLSDRDPNVDPASSVGEQTLLLEFDMIYTRTTDFPVHRVFQEVLHFRSQAYVANDSWISDDEVYGSGGGEDDDGDPFG